MALLSLNDIALSFGPRPLLDGVRLHIESGERLCLLGRNGAGKSTLMKIIEGSLWADDGKITRQPGSRIALLSQVVPAGLAGTIRDIVGAEVPERSSGPPIVDIVLSKMKLEPEADFASLSVGLKRRTLLARALATEPDLLLLDEPTNHLDIEAIEWLESFLLKRLGSLLFITHDRALIHKLATRILELDRGRISNWACDYATFLRRREAQLEAEEKQGRQFDERLKQEEVWIRQGIQARRTRNEGRVRALLQMREERRQRQAAVGGARVTIQEGKVSSRRVIEVKDLSFAYGDNVVLQPFSTSIMRGDKVGFIGPNGAGKTTLLRLLLGELAPGGGTVKHGLRIQAAYFDQLRAQLDDEPCSTASPMAVIEWTSTVRRGIYSPTCRISCLPRNRHSARSVCCPEESATACCWLGCSHVRRTCSPSMNRRTTSTPKRWKCWKPCWWNSPAPC